MICPKCNYPRSTTNYLPLIEVPNYAEFQPLESFTICDACGHGGKTKLEMINKECFVSPHSSQFWHESTLKGYRNARTNTKD